jgi:hypothetical protein
MAREKMLPIVWTTFLARAKHGGEPLARTSRWRLEDESQPWRPYLPYDDAERASFLAADAALGLPNPAMPTKGWVDITLFDKNAYEASNAALVTLLRDFYPNDPGHATPGFPCSKSELLRALGKHETNHKHLDRLIAAGRLELPPAENPVGHHRYSARFTDPAEHARIVALIGQDREDRRTGR